MTFVTDLTFLLNSGILPLLSSYCTKQNALHYHLQINGQNVVLHVVVLKSMINYKVTALMPAIAMLA